MPRLLTSESESELICDRVSICPEAVLLEIHTPPLSEVLAAPLSGLEQDSRLAATFLLLLYASVLLVMLLSKMLFILFYFFLLTSELCVCVFLLSLCMLIFDSGRHSRQGSGGSGDSGVYSTEGGSSRRQQQPDSGHSSVGGDGSSQGLPLPEQLKMDDLGPEPKGEGSIEDEGVMDMCV